MPESAIPAQIPDFEKLKQALAQFKNTGQVDPEAIDLAKNSFFPGVGLSKEEIGVMGPVAVMIRLEEELTKSAQKTPSPLPPSQLDNLTTEVENLSHNLSEEINEEVKRQLSEQHSPHRLQQDVDTVVSQVEDPSTASPPSLAPNLSPNLTAETAQNANLDPLLASVEQALAQLQEGSQITNEWVLKRISSTTFGNSETPFYELQNASGALWTLNQEEMKNLLKTQITLQNQAGPTYESLQPPNMPTPDVNKSTAFSENAPQENTPPVPTQEIKTPPSPEKQEVLTDKQISFLKKLAESKENWETLLSITSGQWQTFSRLYDSGKLSEIGIAASPLIDFLKDPNTASSVTIKKGDNIQKLLEDAGYKLSFLKEDSFLLGVHLLLNYKLIESSHRKVENSGMTVEPLPKENEILSLAKRASEGDTYALNSLKDSLTFLPIEGDFKIIKADKFTDLQKLSLENG